MAPQLGFLVAAQRAAAWSLLVSHCVVDEISVSLRNGLLEKEYRVQSSEFILVKTRQTDQESPEGAAPGERRSTMASQRRAQRQLRVAGAYNSAGNTVREELMQHEHKVSSRISTVLCQVHVLTVLAAN